MIELFQVEEFFFYLMLYVPVNRYDHVGTLPLF